MSKFQLYAHRLCDKKNIKKDVILFLYESFDDKGVQYVSTIDITSTRYINGRLLEEKRITLFPEEYRDMVPEWIKGDSCKFTGQLESREIIFTQNQDQPYNFEICIQIRDNKSFINLTMSEIRTLTEIKDEILSKCINTIS